MHSSRGANWKLWILIIVLVLVIVVLGFLCLRSFLTDTAEPVNTLPTQVAVQDATGKDVSDKLSIYSGTLRPDIADDDADLILMEISLTGKAADNGPFIITVSNDAFPDDDGLAVYHCANGSWELVGTYLIANNSVSFQVSSLSPFAFEVISANPEPTPTAEPTATPEPTQEPEEEPVDYGLYDTLVQGEFTQADAMTENGSYIIAVVNDPDAADTESDVTFFDPDAAEEDAAEEEPITATVLLNYSGEELRTIEVEVEKDASGNYTIADDVVEGMLWTADSSDIVSGETRFALVNNENYLNLDDELENFVMDDNEVRTRWLYENVEPEDGDSFDEFSTLSYWNDSVTYYASSMSMASETAEDPDTLESVVSELIRFTATDDPKQSLTFVLFTQNSVMYDLSSDEDLVLDIGDSASVTGVSVDGSALAISNYTIGDGAITISASYLATLDAGVHSISVALADGSSVNFSVTFYTTEETTAATSGTTILTDTPDALNGIDNEENGGGDGGNTNVTATDPPDVGGGDDVNNIGGGDDDTTDPESPTDTNANTTDPTTTETGSPTDA